MEFYNRRIAEYTDLVARTKSVVASYAWLRLVLIVVAIVSGIVAVKSGAPAFWFGTIGCVAGFLLIVRVHQRRKQLLEFQQTVLKINRDELSYITTNIPQTQDGSEFATDQHAYTHDLDVFGQSSLFHHLARTGTLLGKRAFAASLRERADSETISGRQKAVEELAAKPEFRQEFYAKALLSGDNAKLVAKLSEWTTAQPKFPVAVTVLSIAGPLLFGAMIALYWATGKAIFGSLITTAVIFNLLVLASQLRKILKELADAENIQSTVLRYGELLQLVEKENFESTYLKELANSVTAEGKSSKHIVQLSGIVSAVSSIQNAVGAIIMNGTLLYHVHAYRKLTDWKSKHAANLENWMKVIAELEVLNSFANLKYNNPGFCFPDVNAERKMEFAGLGHPLIHASKRVSNTVSFAQQSFIILTGSNMSGKSTFLRTLGVNMILANAGSCICAESATFQPMDILVSMRLSDSLTDSESYFFAEVKRLKEIMEQLESKAAFVLLDEILRGTNSDDKRSGTIGVIENLVRRNTIGAIATHDLEVCETTDEYPEKLTNKCFEVEIIDNELHFDYRLRDGICQNKSATFLMKKMGVIS